jgi:hypothetical protein
MLCPNGVEISVLGEVGRGSSASSLDVQILG